MLNKNQLKNHKSNEPILNAPLIKISHFKDDKLLKTETYPVIHFLDSHTNDLKQMKYS